MFQHNRLTFVVGCVPSLERLVNLTSACLNQPSVGSGCKVITQDADNLERVTRVTRDAKSKSGIACMKHTCDSLTRVGSYVHGH